MLRDCPHIPNETFQAWWLTGDSQSLCNQLRTQYWLHLTLVLLPALCQKNRGTPYLNSIAWEHRFAFHGLAKLWQAQCLLIAGDAMCAGAHTWFPRGQVEEQRMQEAWERHLSSRRIPQPEVAAQVYWWLSSVGRETQKEPGIQNLDRDKQHWPTMSPALCE